MKISELIEAWEPRSGSDLKEILLALAEDKDVPSETPEPKVGE